MKKATLCFCVKDDQVLLAMKKRGFGSGKWNGYGGKVEEGETPILAAIRELKEESSLLTLPENLKQVALVHFSFDGIPKFECHVFLIHIWKGDPVETEEMSPRWYLISKLPEKMWVADKMWVPLVLKERRKITAWVNFNADGSEVEKFEYEATEF